MAEVMLLTTTGEEESLVVPFPNCPEPFSPQQKIVPAASRAQVCASPAETAATPVKPGTCTGVAESVVPPFPNCPEPFSPQQLTCPVERRAQE
jgi:hypothetical protein